MNSVQAVEYDWLALQPKTKNIEKKKKKKRKSSAAIIMEGKVKTLQNS